MNFKSFLVSIFVLVAFCSVYAQNTTLKVQIVDCRLDQPYSKLNYFRLFRFTDSSVVSKGDFYPNNQWLFYIDSLETGNYRIIHGNNRSKASYLEFVANPKDTTKIILCADGYKNEIENFKSNISQLKEGESLEVYLQSQGCFHYSSDTLVIKNLLGQYVITYKNVSRELTIKEIKIIEDFEFQLTQISTYGGCTTIDSYSLIYNGIRQDFKDKNCSWNGGGVLLRQLGYN